MPNAVIAVSFKDMATDEELHERVEERCRTLADEFPEVTQVEVTITPDGTGHSASGHVSGKSTRLATHASAVEPGHAADQLLDTLRQQLRRAHDKRIFSHRRDAQQRNPKREPRAR
jgi:ribosome-associated translation inhibitor RaiA